MIIKLFDGIVSLVWSLKRLVRSKEYVPFMISVPDKLAVMTYLYQMRAYFTGHELEVQQLGKTTDESSYMIGRFNTDTDVSVQLFGQEIVDMRSNKKSVS